VHEGGAELRVGGGAVVWEQGRAFVFDDSFEHEVEHRGAAPRAVLLLDVWHPGLKPGDRVFV
jgi:aspartate beta-hydroxylase